MSIDGCPHSFARLASEILPEYMTLLRSKMQAPHPMVEFDVRGNGVATIRDRPGLSSDISGCYVLIEGEKARYVGISRKVIARLRQHVRGKTHHHASLAYRMAKQRLPLSSKRSVAMQNEAFKLHFDAARRYIQRLDVAFIQIDNAIELHLFEAFCAMELGTGEWNTFATH